MLVTTMRKYTVAPTATVTLARYGPLPALVRTPLTIAMAGPDVATTDAEALTGPVSALSAVAVLVVVPSTATACTSQVKLAPAASVAGIDAAGGDEIGQVVGQAQTADGRLARVRHDDPDVDGIAREGRDLAEERRRRIEADALRDGEVVVENPSGHDRRRAERSGLVAVDGRGVGRRARARDEGVGAAETMRRRRASSGRRSRRPPGRPPGCRPASLPSGRRHPG